MEYDPKSKSFETSIVSQTDQTERSIKDGKRKPWSRNTRRRRIERMLHNEFATVDEMRATFVQLKSLALEGTEKGIYWQGSLVGREREFQTGYMQMWLDRLIGPVRNDEQIEREVEKRLAEMLELAEREARRRSESVDAKPIDVKAIESEDDEQT
jgi:hypothetical protein